MNVQELIKDNERLRDEVRRCYAELEEYESCFNKLKALIEK